jgi:hypothetical protein
MLRTDVQFDGTGQFVRDPLDPGCPWIPVIPPAMPARFKTMTRRAEDRDQPIYTRWKDGTLTVRQAFIDFDFPATESECVQCEDRIELDEFGKVLFRGTPRGVSFHNAEYHLAALRSGGIRRRRMAFASQLPQPNVRKNGGQTGVNTILGGLGSTVLLLTALIVIVALVVIAILTVAVIALLAADHYFPPRQGAMTTLLLDAGAAGAARAPDAAERPAGFAPPAGVRWFF